MSISLLLLTIAATCVGYYWGKRDRAPCCQQTQIESQLERERKLRKEERAGRTRAEKRLRELTSQSQPLLVKEDSTTYPLKPIGILESCFRQRNGTPRQPLLVPAAKARLKLRSGIPPACLEGLEGYSHCWIIYIFHRNTDLQDLWRPDDRGLKAKVQVPKLNGKRVGVFATRTPHRPNPIGLSVARVDHVSGDTVMFRGADVVDGTPVLDIKPYIPYVDGGVDAQAPAWVSGDSESSVLHVADVSLAEGVADLLQQRWKQSLAQRAATRPLCNSPEEFTELLLQVLSRDIRSLHQRLQHVDSVPKTVRHRGQHNSHMSQYRVMLDGMDVLYNFDKSGSIKVVDVDIDHLYGETNS
ncbi:hypothetical protein ABBQ32_001220 [Trebouxia sp. C0010 RCD-2024]